ncbi:hypothetical protein LguiA_006654 [Lonicera macranthoides]
MNDELSLSKIRTRNGISATSKAQIMASDSDIYIAMIDNKVIVKIGPKHDVGNLIPPNCRIASSGKDYRVWEEK